MADNSAIEWSDATWNPIRARNIKTGKVGWHCEHATTGCEFCYAEGFNKRLGTGLAFKPGHRKDIEIFLDEKMLLQPLRWKKPRMIFVCSMTDLFADFVTDEMIDKMLAVMALCPQHTFQVLTKRAKRMREYLTRHRWHIWAKLGRDLDAKRWNAIPPIMGGDCAPLPNVWLGISTERQQEANERISELLRTPAAVRFISYEPALGPLDLTDIVTQDGIAQVHRNALQCDVALEDDEDWKGATLDWVICGGESGPNARPMHPDWARSPRDQCAAAGVAFFFKQWGEWWPAEQAQAPELRGTEHEDDRMVRVGKKVAGRLLDGVEYNGMPVPRA